MRIITKKQLLLSLAKRNKIRLIESFESIAQCKERTAVDLEKICTGKKRKKRSWTTIKSYSIGQQVNFSNLARTHRLKDATGNTPNNADQIVREYLEINDIDGNKFTTNIKVTA